MNAEPNDPLPRGLGLGTGVAVVVASMVGTGILAGPAYTLAGVGDFRVALGLWALGGLLAAFGTLTLAELATAYPKVGGEYVYVEKAFGRLAGFYYGWGSLVVGFAAPTAFVAMLAAKYLAGALPDAHAAWWTSARQEALATLLILLFTWLHAQGQRESAWAQNLTTWFKFGTLFGLAVVGLLFGRGDWGNLTAVAPDPPEGPPTRWAFFATAAVSLIYIKYSYTGWNAAVYLAGEIRDPGRNLPRALLGGCAVVTALYLVIVVAFGYAAGPETVRQLKSDDLDTFARFACGRFFPGRPWAANLLSLLVGMGLLATISAFLLSGGRLAFAMARHGQLPPFLETWDNRRNAPTVATWSQGLLAAGFVLALGGKVEVLLEYIGTGLALLALLFGASVFVLRRRPDYAPAFRMPLFPLPTLVYLSVTLAMIGLAASKNSNVLLYSVASIGAGTFLPFVDRNGRTVANR